jgi:hypothetical protein
VNFLEEVSGSGDFVLLLSRSSGLSESPQRESFAVGLLSPGLFFYPIVKGALFFTVHVIHRDICFISFKYIPLRPEKCEICSSGVNEKSGVKLCQVVED